MTNLILLRHGASSTSRNSPLGDFDPASLHSGVRNPVDSMHLGGDAVLKQGSYKRAVHPHHLARLFLTISLGRRETTAMVKLPLP